LPKRSLSAAITNTGLSVPEQAVPKLSWVSGMERVTHDTFVIHM
jgi:hypothetical protein